MEVVSFHAENRFTRFTKALNERGSTTVLNFEGEVVGWYCLVEVLHASFAVVALIILYYLLLTALAG